jgi:hypothetical protein
MARPGRGAAVSVASAPPPAARAVRVPGPAQGLSAAAAKPRRPKWVVYAGISAGGGAGVILLVVLLGLVSGSRGPQQKPVADQPTSESISPVPASEVSEPRPDTGSSTVASGPEAHRAVIDALIRAYDNIADGYAQINDAASIPRGEGRIARGAEELKAAAERGRSLPPLQLDEHAVLTGSKGPSLILAVERVIQQLRRLKATPGIKADFDRLIDAYTRTRQEIDREMQSAGTGPSRSPSLGGPPAPSAPRGRPPGPPRRSRGRL